MQSLGRAAWTTSTYFDTILYAAHTVVVLLNRLAAEMRVALLEAGAEYRGAASSHKSSLRMIVRVRIGRDRNLQPRAIVRVRIRAALVPGRRASRRRSVRRLEGGRTLGSSDVWARTVLRRGMIRRRRVLV